ncbi:nucleotidyltransferase-like protein [Bacillus sp. FJAT-44742]|uniref:nucleotidyltransferase-like protein n=1 Tax=Bacillus sp. FJAT-44742 TaxID=2014005 RepID=UPI000C2351BB|nr:nucleotidyltransferase-like protein [Bacillus sp. FJAT-44742]
MKEKFQHIYKEFENSPDTLGILSVRKKETQESFTDFFDVIVVVIVKMETQTNVKHYDCDGRSVALHLVTEKEIFHWMITGANRKVIEWVFKGRILFNRNEAVTSLRERLNNFHAVDQEQKIGVEFAKLIRYFEDGKSLYNGLNFLDAFHHFMRALQHLARLNIIEQGRYPEITVWEQVRDIEPETYKLYQELVLGEEPLEKRLELLMIAIEFAIRSNLKIGSVHLLTVMEKRTGSWTFEELAGQREVQEYIIDLEVVIAYLADQGVIEKFEKDSSTPGVSYLNYHLQER